MPRYRVTEVVEYMVDADDEDAAIHVIIHTEDRDAYWIGIAARYAVEQDQ
jgi:hypothetical protein